MFSMSKNALNNSKNGRGGAHAAKLLTPVDDQTEADDTAFGRWLTRKLHVVFDGVSQEPLPDDLLQLVRNLEAKEQKSAAATQANSVTAT